MKQILLFTGLIFALINCYAQSSNAEAKAAYMLAEEEFAAGKYAASIFYLEVAATKLKGANAKIMYLKIMALSELVKTNSDSLQSLNNAISAFEKTPDFSTFNEDKQIEVMKLKMKLGREAKFGREISAIEAMVYLKMQIIGWQLGNTLEETKKAHPDYFLKAAKTQLNKEIETYSSDRKDVNAIFTKEKLTALSKDLLFMSNDNASYSAGNNLYNDFKNYLGTSATETITVQPVQNTGLKWYTTSSSTKTISWKDDSILVVAVLYLKSEKVRKDSKYESTFMISVSLLN
jgi:hypothetical protein